MDKNSNNKFTNFFKKEGFYVILFVCLCVVATLAAVTAKNTKNITPKPVVTGAKDESPKEVGLTSDEILKQKNYDNAKLVTKDTANSKVAIADGSKTVQANAKAAPSFKQPVSGKLIQGFSENPVLVGKNSGANVIQTWKTIDGMYISSKLGQDVFSAESGTVEKVANDGAEGMSIVINHNNGYKTVYSNLSNDVTVKENASVAKGEKIGTVGNTATNYLHYEDLANGYIHFQVLNNNTSVDPSKYGVNYEKLNK